MLSGKAKCERSKFIGQCNLRYETKIENKLMCKNRNTMHRCMPFGLQKKLCKHVMMICKHSIKVYKNIRTETAQHLMVEDKRVIAKCKSIHQ